MPVAHGLANGDYVRDDIFTLQLEGPPMSANPAESDLDLVSNANSTSIANVPGNNTIMTIFS